jgi:hypothetical protein
VLAERSIGRIKTAHRTREEIAFIGNIHAGSFDNIALNLYLGNSNYLTLIKTSQGRRQLIENPLLCDRRNDRIEEIIQSGFLWVLYYSAYCSIESSVFFELGGFEEACQLWGGEDIDLGYKISLRGSIGFLNDVHGLHVPHPRNIIKNDYTNEGNFRMLYKKHRTWEFEVLSSYRADASLLCMFDRIRNQMRLLNLAPIGVCGDSKEIFFDVVSSQNPEGSITVLEDGSNIVRLESMGLMVDYCDKYFRVAYVSDNVFIYPSFVTARILQESSRISQKTYIVASGDSIRIDWHQIPNLKHYRKLIRTEYASYDLMEYSYTTNGSYIEVSRLY